MEEDAAFTFLQSLSGDLPIFDFYPIFFPTDEMKRTLAMLFIHILDLLDQLAKHFALGGLGGVFLRLNNISTDLL